MSPPEVTLLKSLEKEAGIAEAKAKYIGRRLRKTIAAEPKQQWLDARDLYLAHAKTLRKLMDRMTVQTDGQ